MAAAAEAEGIQRFTIPGLPPFVVAPAKKLNVSTGSLDFVWGNDVILLSTPPSAAGVDENTIASHLTFRTKGRSGTGWTTNEYMPFGRGLEGGTMLEMGHKEGIYFVCNRAGGFIQNAVQ